ncbi:PIN domain-containing protein [Nocardia panacis]|uniref:Ribonuclease VapC n=1 Tax=Nocardia panacis TaxID=2340916 RepID=A0A3A4KJ10_9NOCA|nr:PIN domain-containing protein [Nocardia panacis]RJO74862.1 PIN domain-containing protein [Nocardia panacis]
MKYLIDTSGIWNVLRDKGTRTKLFSVLETGSVKVCSPTRLEFLFSARGPVDRDKMESNLDVLFDSVSVPKDPWRWAEMAQYKLTQHGQHRGPGPMDLVLCATAVHHGLTMLHADNDFTTVSRVMPELTEIDIRRL